jgi:hypothetical protein
MRTLLVMASGDISHSLSRNREKGNSRFRGDKSVTRASHQSLPQARESRAAFLDERRVPSERPAMKTLQLHLAAGTALPSAGAARSDVRHPAAADAHGADGHDARDFPLIVAASVWSERSTAAGSMM